MRWRKIRRMDTDHPKELFENEIRILRDQPIRGDMPEWFDNGEHEGRPYVVMALLEKLPRQMSVKVCCLSLTIWTPGVFLPVPA